MEGQVPLKYGADAVEIKGSRALLEHVESANVPWAIVTSGTRPLVDGWLKILGLAQPQHLVTAEDVPKGKPNPACYQLGMQKLGLGGTYRPLVIEDAPAGIRAGKAANLRVLAVATTHTPESLIEAGADWVVKDLSCLKIINVNVDGLLTLEIRDALRIDEKGLR
jgi:glycerol-1-phosphatase